MDLTKLPPADRKALSLSKEGKMENSIRVLTNDARFYKRQVIPSLIFGFFLFGVGVLYPSIVFIGFGIAGFVNFFLMRRKSRTTLEKAKRLKAKHRELQEQKNLF